MLIFVKNDLYVFFYGLNYETDHAAHLFVDSGHESKKAFMYPKSEMLGVFSELATADKEQTVANPIIIKVSLTVPYPQFYSSLCLCEICKSLRPKPVKDNFAMLYGNL